jgi:ABC-type phosphate transport system substrate-binding protein
MASALTFGQVALAEDADLALIVNRANKEHLTTTDIEQIFRSSRRFWSGGKPITALNLAAGSPERVAFDRAVLRLEPDDVGRFWIDRKIRGGEPPPHTVPNTSLVAALVTQLENAIGYVPIPLVSAGVRVVARIRGRDVQIAAHLLQPLEVA